MSHIFICSFPPVSAMNIVSREGGGGREGGKVCCSRGGSRLMNVCSVLITPLNYINPPSELRRVTRTEGSAESKVKPPPSHPPRIPVSSLNSSLLFIFACSPTPLTHVNTPPPPPPLRPPSAVGLLLFCVSSSISAAALQAGDRFPLMDRGPLSIRAALCFGKAAFAGYLSENERWLRDGKLQASGSLKA